MGAHPERGFDVVRLERPDDVDGWRTAARARLAAGVPPEDIVWQADAAATSDLFAAEPPPEPGATLVAERAVNSLGDGDPRGEGPTGDPLAASSSPPDARGTGVAPPSVPRAFLELAERVACHREPDRYALLYRVLWRLAHGEPGLLRDASDADVHRLARLGKAVARERHKMHAFVRFRRTPGVEPEHFGAWFEPEHHTLRLASGFFVRRFATMCWSIVTPAESAHWDTRELVFGPGGRVGDAGGPGAGEEAMEALWRTYFANIFNPARLKLDAMRAEMPVKYWKNLPEAPLIAGLVAEAGARTAAMIATPPTRPPRFAARAVHPEAPRPAAGAPASDRSPAGSPTDPFART